MKIRRFQEGGQMVPTTAGSQDPLAQIAEMAAQAVQQNDGNMALRVCEALLQLIQEAMQQNEGGATEQVPEQAPQEEQGEPVYRRGGRLVRRK